MKPVLQAILFDLDGTLLDSRGQDEEQIRRLLTDLLGLRADPEDISRFIGMPSREILGEVAPDRINELMPVLANLQHQTSDLAVIFSGIKPIIQKLAQIGFSLGVVTSKNREELRISLLAYDLPEQISIWIAADDVSKPKPDPEPICGSIERTPEFEVSILKFISVVVRLLHILGDESLREIVAIGRQIDCCDLLLTIADPGGLSANRLDISVVAALRFTADKTIVGRIETQHCRQERELGQPNALIYVFASVAHDLTAQRASR